MDTPDIPYVTLASEQARSLLTMLGTDWHPEAVYGLIAEGDLALVGAAWVRGTSRPAVCIVTPRGPTHVWTGVTWATL